MCCTSLPDDILFKIFDNLTTNEKACTIKCVSKQTYSHYKGVNHIDLLKYLPEYVNPNTLVLDRTALKQYSFKQKLLALTAAAKTGKLANVCMVWSLLEPCLTPDFQWPKQYTDPGSAACCAGAWSIVPWMLENNVPIDIQRTLEASACFCSLLDLKDAYSLLGTYLVDSVRDTHICAGAAGSSTSDAYDKLKWIDTRVTGWHLGACVEAIRTGNLERVQWVYQRKSWVLPQTSLVIKALDYGNMEVVEWIHAHCTEAKPWSSHLSNLILIAASRKISTLEWALGQGLQVTPEALRAAARHGSVDAVRFLYEDCNIHLTSSVFNEACMSGNIQLCEYLVKQGCPMHVDAYRTPGASDDLAMVTWLLDVAKCHRTNIFSNAPMNVILHILTAATLSARDVRCIDVVKRLVAAGTTIDCHCQPSLNAAAQIGSIELVEYIHSLGGKCNDDTLSYAVRGGCEAVLDWVLGHWSTFNPSPLGTDLVSIARRKGDQNTVMYLLARSES